MIKWLLVCFYRIKPRNQRWSTNFFTLFMYVRSSSSSRWKPSVSPSAPNCRWQWHWLLVLRSQTCQSVWTQCWCWQQQRPSWSEAAERGPAEPCWWDGFASATRTSRWPVSSWPLGGQLRAGGRFSIRPAPGQVNQSKTETIRHDRGKIQGFLSVT